MSEMPENHMVIINTSRNTLINHSNNILNNQVVTMVMNWLAEYLRFRSTQGGDEFAILRSLIAATAKKQGWNVIGALS